VLTEHIPLPPFPCPEPVVFSVAAWDVGYEIWLERSPQLNYRLGSVPHGVNPVLACAEMRTRLRVIEALGV
jgi:hypothetical protein